MVTPADPSADITLVNTEFADYTVRILRGLRGTHGAGSGIPVAIKEGYIYVLTNAHVVEETYLPPIMDRPDTPLTVSVDGQSHEVTVVDISEVDDMALLRFPDPGDSNLRIPAAAIGDPAVGESLFAVGFSNYFLDENFEADPFSESLKVVDVKVGQVLPFEVGEAGIPSKSGYQIVTYDDSLSADYDSPVIKGMSGGPLYRVENGAPVLVGMNGLNTSSSLFGRFQGVFTVSGEDNNGSNVIELPPARSLHIPIDRIQEYLNANGILLRGKEDIDSDLGSSTLPTQVVSEQETGVNVPESPEPSSSASPEEQPAAASNPEAPSSASEQNLTVDALPELLESAIDRAVSNPGKEQSLKMTTAPANGSVSYKVIVSADSAGLVTVDMQQDGNSGGLDLERPISSKLTLIKNGDSYGVRGAAFSGLMGPVVHLTDPDQISIALGLLQDASWEGALASSTASSNSDISPSPNPLGAPTETRTPSPLTPPPVAQSTDFQQDFSQGRLTSWISLGARLGGQFVQNLGLSEIGALFDQIGGVPAVQDILNTVMNLGSNIGGIQTSLQALEARVDGAVEAIDGKLADAQGLLERANRNRETLQSDERFPNMLQEELGSLATDPTLNTLAGFAKLFSERADSIPDASLRSAVKGLNGPSRLLDVLESLSNLEDSSVAAAIFASRAQGNDPDPILLTNELIRNLREGINKYQSEGPSSAIHYLVQSGTLHKFNNLADVLIERGDNYQVELRPEAEPPV